MPRRIARRLQRDSHVLARLAMVASLVIGMACSSTEDDGSETSVLAIAAGSIPTFSCYAMEFGQWMGGPVPVMPPRRIRLLANNQRSVVPFRGESLHYASATWLHLPSDSLRITFIDGETGTHLELARTRNGGWNGVAGAWFHFRTADPVSAPVALQRIACAD